MQEGIISGYGRLLYLWSGDTWNTLGDDGVAAICCDMLYQEVTCLWGKSENNVAGSNLGAGGESFAKILILMRDILV